MTEAIVFAAGLFLGITTAKAGTIAVRSHIRDPNPMFTLIKFGSMVSTFALVAWGFVVLPWYWSILAFVGISLLVRIIVLETIWLFFYKTMPVTGLLTMAAVVYCWYAWASG